MNAVRTMRDRIPDLVVICNGVLILSRDRITTVVVLSRDRITTVVILSWTMRDRITDFVVIW